MTLDPLALVGRTIDDKYVVEAVVGEGGFAVRVHGWPRLTEPEPPTLPLLAARPVRGDPEAEEERRQRSEGVARGSVPTSGRSGRSLASPAAG